MRSVKTDRFFYPFVIPLIPKPNKTNTKLLDLGAGMGELSQKAKELGWITTSCDVDPNNIQYINSQGLLGIQHNLNEKLPFDNNSFNSIILIEVIEHLTNAEQLVEECARVLAPDGLLLLSTPNIAFYKRRIRALYGKPPSGEGYHFRFFIKRHLKRLLKQNSFEIVKTNSFGYPPLINKLTLRRTLKKKKIRFFIPYFAEVLFAENFVWLLRKT